jgi:DNA (cytosine-5)-methyltransferase 1
MHNLDWSTQVKIIDDCIKHNRVLHEVLFANNYTYDDLRYEIEIPFENTGGEYKNIEENYQKKNGISVLSFFSGCGGLDLGFEAAGFEFIACIDNNELFCNTLRHNHPTWEVIGPPEDRGDVSKREDLYNTLKKYITSNFEGVFIGGPPCQSFSIAANQRFAKGDSNFKRVGFSHKIHGNLLFDFIWFVKKFNPQAFLIENVTGLVTIDKGEQLKMALSELMDLDYIISGPCILDAADFDVPQFRKRLFIIGSKKGMFSFPFSRNKMIPCHKALNIQKNITNHVTRLHKAESLKRYMYLKCGERDQLGRADRLDPNRPAKTVIAGGTQGGGRSHLHPSIPRTLSVRECARLQTFPDSFQFYGSIARQFTQVGNAVPPFLGYHLAKAMAKQIFE